MTVIAFILEPNPSNKEDRKEVAKNLSTALEDKDFLSLSHPSQVVHIGSVENILSDNKYTLSSNLSSHYFIGKEDDIENFLVSCSNCLLDKLQSTYDIQNKGLIALWSHPDKDMLLMGIIIDGDWCPSLKDSIDNIPEGIIPIANLKSNHLPSVIVDIIYNKENYLPYDTLTDLSQTVLCNIPKENLEDILDELEEFEDIVDSVQDYFPDNKYMFNF